MKPHVLNAPNHRVSHGNPEQSDEKFSSFTLNKKGSCQSEQKLICARNSFSAFTYWLKSFLSTIKRFFPLEIFAVFLSQIIAGKEILLNFLLILFIK